MVGNNPTSRADAFGLYEVDTHRYLTEFLAKHAGFCGDTPTAIGGDTQALDDPDSTRDAMYGGRNEGNMKAFHFPSQLQLASLRQKAFDSCCKCEKQDWKAIGEYLHALEDTFAHTTGKGDRNWQYYDDLGINVNVPKLPTVDVYGIGHGGHGHRPDWTWEDPAKAMKMAELVFNDLRELAKSCGGNCPASSWDSIKDRVSKFANHKPSSFYKERVYVIWIDNVTFEGYDEKIKLLDPNFSLDPMYKKVRKCKAK